MGVRLRLGPDAFGNALGSSLAESLGPRYTAQESFRRGEINQQNAQAAAVQGVGPWSAADYRNGSDVESDRVSTLNGFVQAFSNPAAVDPGEGTLLAAGPGYTGGLGKIDWHSEQVERAMRLAEESDAQEEGVGPYRASRLVDVPAGVVDMAPTKANAIRLGLMEPNGQTEGTWASPVTQSNVVGVPLPPLGSSVMGPSLTELEGMSYGEQMRNVGKFFGDLGSLCTNPCAVCLDIAEAQTIRP